MQQTANGVTTSYTLDLNGDLTQVLGDGTNLYLYGLGRIGEQPAGSLGTEGWHYYLTDALGSVRQMVTGSSLITPTVTLDLAQSYAPFGSVLTSAGTATTAYGFTGEWHMP